MEHLDINISLSEHMYTYNTHTWTVVMLLFRTSSLCLLAYSSHAHSSHNSSWWSLVPPFSLCTVSWSNAWALRVSMCLWLGCFCVGFFCTPPPCPPHRLSCIGHISGVCALRPLVSLASEEPWQEGDQEKRWGQAIYSPGSPPAGSHQDDRDSQLQVTVPFKSLPKIPSSRSW